MTSHHTASASSIAVRGNVTLGGGDAGSVRDSKVSKVSMSVMDLGGEEGVAAWDTDDDLDFDG